MSRTYERATKRPMRCEGCGALCANAVSYFDHVRDCPDVWEAYNSPFARPLTLPMKGRC